MDPSEYIFGNSKLKEIKKGDLVRWHTLIEKDTSTNGYKENIGIVRDVTITFRGGRNVAMAKIIPLNADKFTGYEIEVFLACLKVISKSVME